MFSVVAVLGLVPDLFYSKYHYRAPQGYVLNNFNTAVSPWYPMLKGAEAMSLDMQIQVMPPDLSFCLVLTVGIRFGNMLDAHTIEQVKRTGVAKVLATA